MAQYSVTPAKGRAGKTRDVKPLEIEVPGLAGDLDEMLDAVAASIGKIAKRRKCFATYEVLPNESHVYRVEVWCNDDLVASCTVETLEEL